MCLKCSSVTNWVWFIFTPLYLLMCHHTPLFWSMTLMLVKLNLLNSMPTLVHGENGQHEKKSQLLVRKQPSKAQQQPLDLSMFACTKVQFEPLVSAQTLGRLMQSLCQTLSRCLVWRTVLTASAPPDSLRSLIYSAYRQVPLTLSASDISAFDTPWCFKQYTLMAFGMRICFILSLSLLLPPFMPQTSYGS